MSSWSHSIDYSCASDCQFEGCPGHTATLTYISTSDQFRVSVDDKSLLLGDIALLDAIRDLANR
jgi:hypothetical protein